MPTGPGSPGFVQSPYDARDPDITGDVLVPAGSTTATTQHVQSNNSTSSFISTNVPCAASVQTVITSVTLPPGTWALTANVSASVNAALSLGNQEIALIPHGGAASSGYAGGVLNTDIKETEASGALDALIILAATTQIDLVGSSTATSPWTALATTTSGYANATGVIASPTV